MLEGVLSTTVFIQIAPGNVLRYHNKHLMGYFESRYGSRIIFLPLNISEKLHWQCVFEKLEKAERNNMRHPEEQHLPFKQTGTIIIFSSRYQSCNCPRSGPFFWQNPCFKRCNKGKTNSSAYQIL